MSLTDAQIDRYSRQIIVPRVGGRGQERLLGARMLLVGDARDIEAPLAFLVGAGVGTICLKLSAAQGIFTGEPELNPDGTVTNELKAPIELALAIVGSDATRKVADALANNRDVPALVIARLDAPARIFVITDAQGPDYVNEQFGRRSEAADFIAMLATAEAFKLLARYSENPSRATTEIEFDGYATTVRVHS